MLETKLFEVRDRMTMFAVIATRMRVVDREPVGEGTRADAEEFLLGRSGYEPADGLILLTYLAGRSPAVYDPYDWDMRRGRTMHHAHLWIQEHWDDLTSGDVVDVEFVLGETTAPKVSERLR